MDEPRWKIPGSSRLLYMSQYEIPWWQVDFGPSAGEDVKNEILNKRLSMGQTTREFEKRIEKILDVRHCVATGSGSTALLMALLATGIRSKDVVAVQDRSWISAAHAAHMIDAQIVLIDVERDTPVIDMDSLEKVFSQNPRCIILIHMNGRSSHLSEIADKCKQRGIILIEDSAQAIGSMSEKKYLGTFGDVGCFSLALTKTISSGQGGFCVTNDSEIYKRLRELRSHGMDDVFFPEWKNFGMNFRFTDPQASIALNQLSFLSTRLNRQIEVRDEYLEGTKHLKNIRVLNVAHELGENGPYFDCEVTNLKVFQELMQINSIQVRPFYPSISTARYLNILNRNQTPNAEHWHLHGVSLPSGPNISDMQIKKVIQALCDIDGKLSVEL